jgi:hypothetical protein
MSRERVCLYDMRRISLDFFTTIMTVCCWAAYETTSGRCWISRQNEFASHWLFARVCDSVGITLFWHGMSVFVIAIGVHGWDIWHLWDSVT